MAKRITIEWRGEKVHLSLQEARELFFMLLALLLGDVKERAED